MAPVDHHTTATDTFFFGLCTLAAHATPFKLFKCVQDDNTKTWTHTAVEVADLDGDDSKFRNCLVL